MNRSGKLDHDDIVRARTALLASGRRTPLEEVAAYRVLAQVSPASYLHRLAKALVHLSHDAGLGDGHPARLALCEEAVSAARAVDPAEPGRANLLYNTLDSCQRELYARGRRAEGLAMRAEMVAVGRAQAERSGNPEVRGLSVWAIGLSEEGRYDEAADALTESVAALLPGRSDGGSDAWSLMEWVAALDAAGRSDELLAAFGTFVSREAAAAADKHGLAVCHFHSLVGYAQKLDAYGRAEQAASVWQEALAVLTVLCATGDRRRTGSYETSFWAVLLSFSGADREWLKSVGPRPPLGATVMRWSPDARRLYFDSLGTLGEEVDTLAVRAAEDPDRHLAELVRLHRILTIRSAVYWENRHNPFTERLHSLFDGGVDLADRLRRHRPADGVPALADALIDRSTFRAAAGEFNPALADFREALNRLGEAD
ncbi:hypothetical protein [Streptomyces sp. YIM S03343]